MNGLGEFINHKRRESGLSMQNLAAACNVSNTTICNLEHDKIQKPKVEYLRAIAKALNCDESEMMLRAGYGNLNSGSESHHPLSTIQVPRELENNELQEVQTFIDFIIYKHKAALKGE